MRFKEFQKTIIAVTCFFIFQYGLLSQNYPNSIKGEIDSLEKVLSDLSEKDPAKLDLLFKIGNLFETLSANNLAIDNYTDAVELAESEFPEYRLDKIYKRLANSYEKKGMYAEALGQYRKYENKYREEGNEGNHSWIDLKMGEAYRELGIFDTAEIRLDLALELSYIQKDDSILQNTLYEFGALYLQQNQLREALGNFLQVFNLSENNNEIKSKAGIKAGEIYWKLGETAIAETYLLQGIAIAEEESFILSATDGYRVLSSYYEDIGEFDSSLIAFGNYKTYNDSLTTVNSNNRYNELQLEFATEQKEIELANQKSLLKESNDALSSEQRFRAVLTIGIILIFVLAVLIYFYFRGKENAKRKILEQKQKLDKVALQNEISELKLLALRAQMNPHFIFNTLHTIQGLILKSESVEAHESLSKFSSLIQYILECTKKEFVSLKEETDFLAMYVALEKLRFEDKFDFEVLIGNGLLDSNPDIPPMVIQPHIENAIQHGLLNKDGFGTLKMEFNESDGMVLCKIEDNGVGRAEAARINRFKDRVHTSIGIKNTEKRLKLYEQGGKTFVNIIDKEDDEGNSAGTIIEINLPVRND